MNAPTVLAQAIGPSSPVEVGLLVWGVIVGIAWGEARYQIAHLREKDGKRDTAHDAMLTRVTAIEVREGRTGERLDALSARLDRIELKIDRLLERGTHQ